MTTEEFLLPGLWEEKCFAASERLTQSVWEDAEKGGDALGDILTLDREELQGIIRNAVRSSVASVFVRLGVVEDPGKVE